MKKELLFGMAVAAVFAASAQLPYKVIVPTIPEAEGKVAKLMNADSQTVIDSVVVKDIRPIERRPHFGAVQRVAGEISRVCQWCQS